MSVGILTWWDVLNYGSAFQAYALQQELCDMGAEVEILTHDRKLPDHFGNRLSERSVAGVARWIRNQSPNRCRSRREAKRKYDEFKRFYGERLNIGAHYGETDAASVIIGSDQIFDVNAFYYPFQFGGSVSCDNISAYAPCFGETGWERLREHPAFEDICSGIRKMKTVTARDVNTQAILQRILDREVQLVLDPVLLYGFEKEKKLWKERTIDGKYCLVYTWGGYTTSEEFASQCRSFAERTGCRLVSVGEVRRWCDIQRAHASPEEFFELFLHADMVLTNMFHGTCFSIIMEKPFYSFVMPHNENKVSSILRELGLTGMMMRTPAELQAYGIPQIDYASAGRTLKQKREVSRQLLLAMIN